MPWNEDLLNFLTENKYYRLDFLNRQIAESSKVWIDLINEFHGLEARLVDKTYTYCDIEISCKYIEIKDKRKGRLPFKAYIGYFSNASEELCLFINTPIEYEINVGRIKMAKEKGANDPEDDEFYNWDENKEIKDSRMYEPDFIFELLNKRFMKFFNREANISAFGNNR